MRKHQQRKILELLTTLSEAHTELRKMTAREPRMGLLADCQEFAVTVGGYIEELQGEGTETVALLEGYCELLFHLSEETGPKINTKVLEKQLSKIRNMVETELKPDKIEVAFFPYKASMWDSLESVWLAAKEDPQCDAFVVPIPYYDKTPDGKLGQFHYEGDLYPDYVPVTNWQEYDVAARHPDVAFIHNPYDGGNFVTTVHPDYYSSRLKEHTELLCYSPYFVVTEDVDEISCALPGVCHSHRVYVQSEQVGQTYLCAFGEFAREYRWGDQFGRIEEKVVATGSPKFDKAISSKPGDYPMPEEWRRLMTHPDGSPKKAVLYNTTIAAVLDGDKQYLRKIRHVLESFRRRDDLVLWWRPHPLNQATYGSMRPELLDAYEKTIAEYKTAGYGIYDDSADPQRAIACTDAYYGDGGSMVALYQCTGKPIIFQQTKRTPDNECMKNLTFLNRYNDGEWLWFTPTDFNALFRMDRESWEPEYMGSVPGEAADGAYLHMEMVQVEECLYFAPTSARSLAVYHKTDGVFETVPLPCPDLERVPDGGRSYLERSKFSRVFAYGGRLFFIPSTYPGILCYDPSSGDMQVIDSWVGPLSRMICNPEASYFGNGVVNEEEGTLLLACACANAVLELSLESCEFEIHRMGDADDGYVELVRHGDDYWLLPIETAALIHWDRSGSAVERYEVPVDTPLQPHLAPYQRLYLEKDSLCLIPNTAKELLRFDLREETFSVVEGFAAKEEGPEDPSTAYWMRNYLFLYGKHKEAIDAHTGWTNRCIEFDPATGARREQGIQVKDKSVLGELVLQAWNREEIQPVGADDCAFREGYLTGLEECLDEIAADRPSQGVQQLLEEQTRLRLESISHPDGGAGKAIYEDCKKAVWKG